MFLNHQRIFLFFCILYSQKLLHSNEDSFDLHCLAWPGLVYHNVTLDSYLIISSVNFAVLKKWFLITCNFSAQFSQPTSQPNNREICQGKSLFITCAASSSSSFYSRRWINIFNLLLPPLFFVRFLKEHSLTLLRDLRLNLPLRHRNYHNCISIVIKSYLCYFKMKKKLLLEFSLFFFLGKV